MLWKRRRGRTWPEPKTEDVVGRRKVLRLGGLAAASTAGAAVAGVGSASSAAAAPGENMVLGVPNDSGNAQTRLTSTSGTGVLGVVSGAAGPAVQATGQTVPAGGAVSAAGNGPALSVQGVATFTRSGTVGMIAVSSIDVSVPGGMTKTSKAFAVVQSIPQPSVNGTFEQPMVIAVHPTPETGKLTIYLDRRPDYAVKVAWFVIG